MLIHTTARTSVVAEVRTSCSHSRTSGSLGWPHISYTGLSSVQLHQRLGRHGPAVFLLCNGRWNKAILATIWSCLSPWDSPRLQDRRKHPQLLDNFRVGPSQPWVLTGPNPILCYFAATLRGQNELPGWNGRAAVMRNSGLVSLVEWLIEKQPQIFSKTEPCD